MITNWDLFENGRPSWNMYHSWQNLSVTSTFFICDSFFRLYPVIEKEQSDSGCVDNVMEFLVMAGNRSLPEVSIQYSFFWILTKGEAAWRGSIARKASWGSVILCCYLSRFLPSFQTGCNDAGARSMAERYPNGCVQKEFLQMGIMLNGTMGWTR